MCIYIYAAWCIDINANIYLYACIHKYIYTFTYSHV